MDNKVFELKFWGYEPGNPDNTIEVVFTPLDFASSLEAHSDEDIDNFLDAVQYHIYDVRRERASWENSF